MYRLFIKRFIDVMISLVMLIVLSPIITLTATILLLINKGNPFFFQDRPGLNEKKIRIIKFKSMTDQKDIHGNLLPDFKRTTK